MTSRDTSVDSTFPTTPRPTTSRTGHTPIAFDVADHSDCYGYIPLPRKEWDPSFAAARAHLGADPGSFLDIGCGTGTKVLRANRAGFDAWGLEIRPRYAALARKLGAQVIDGDAREYVDYHLYSCVFLFHPLIEGEADLEQKVMELMAPGAVLILYGSELPRHWPEVGEHCWVKPA